MIDLDDERGFYQDKRWAAKTRAYLFEKPALLDNIGDSLLLDAFCLVDVLEGIELFCSFVLDDSDLGKEMFDK
jgi:hypothetical protein